MCSVAGGAGTPRRDVVAEMVRLTAYRGPDGQGFVEWPPGRPRVVLGHARLAIVDPARGMQPLGDEGGRTWLAANGEIYNHLELRRQLLSRGHRFQTGSDAEVLVHLAEEALGSSPEPAVVAQRLAGAFRSLDGMFAVAIWGALEGDAGWLVLARDALGIRPLYFGRDGPSVYFASEVKAIRRACREYREFPPGHVAVWPVGVDGAAGEPAMVAFADLWWARADSGTGGGAEVGGGAAPDGLADGRAVPEDARRPVNVAEAAGELERLLEQAVVKRLMADVPVGVLLSGGVDSALIATFARRHYAGRLHTFAVGAEHGPDLAASMEAAAAVGSVHHVRRFGEREARQLLPAVIYHLESFDAPLVRSALANYLVFELAADYAPVVLTGEGSDELFAGYDSLQGLSGSGLDRELARLVASLHHTNLQRADRMGLAHGVEARVPFLDLQLVGWARALPAALKRRAGPDGQEEDKAVVRELAGRLLPGSIARRPKAKFSQGSGAAAILRQVAHSLLTDREWLRLQARFPQAPLSSKEQALYFRIFMEYFPEEAARLTVGITRSVVPGEVA